MVLCVHIARVLSKKFGRIHHINTCMYMQYCTHTLEEVFITAGDCIHMRRGITDQVEVLSSLESCGGLHQII